MFRVAAHRRADPEALYRRASFAWLCVAFAFLVTQERERDTYRTRARRSERFHLAGLVNLAMADGKALAQETDRFNASLDAEIADVRDEIPPADGLEVLRQALAESAARTAILAAEVH